MEDELAKEEFSSLVEVEPISFKSKQDLWPFLYLEEPVGQSTSRVQ